MPSVNDVICVVISWSTAYRGGFKRYMVKPHGQLVRVSFAIARFTHRAYQPRSLRGPYRVVKPPARSNLEGGFTLRCFQRLSRPYIATRRCHWHDNRCTRGTSNPVLSY